MAQRAMTPCGWGVKAGMVRVWVAGVAAIPLLHMAISEHFRDKGLTIKHYINSFVYFTYTIHS